MHTKTTTNNRRSCLAPSTHQHPRLSRGEPSTGSPFGVTDPPRREVPTSLEDRTDTRNTDLLQPETSNIPPGSGPGGEAPPTAVSAPNTQTEGMRAVRPALQCTQPAGSASAAEDSGVTQDQVLEDEGRISTRTRSRTKDDGRELRDYPPTCSTTREHM